MKHGRRLGLIGRIFTPLTLAVVGVLALGACSKEAPVAAEKPPAAAVDAENLAQANPPSVQPASATINGALEAAVNKVAEANFDLVIQPKGEYAAGQAAQAEIVLDAKGPFKVNDKYPYKFKLKEGAGLTYPSTVVGKDQVKLEHKRATMPVAFTADKPGKHTLAGQFSFSICTDDKCLIEKRDLALAVHVK